QREAADADSEIQDEVQEGNVGGGIPLALAGRPEGESGGGGVRYGHAAIGFFAEPAKPAAPLRAGRGRGVHSAAGDVKAGDRKTRARRVARSFCLPAYRVITHHPCPDTLPLKNGNAFSRSRI